jgi:hypothetical protein
MRSTARLACAAIAGALLLASGVSLAGQADAVPVPTLTGTAPATAHSPGSVTFTYTVNVPFATQATTFTTHQDAALPATATGVTLDGAAVPAAQITQSGADITIQVGADPFDGLTAGTHTIAFSATVGTASASTSSTGELDWSVDGIPGTLTSAPVTVAVNPIDIATVLTPDTDEDQIGFAGTGEEGLLFVDVSNVGYGAPDSQLEIDLPAGMAIGADGVSRDDDGSTLSCTPSAGNAQHIICDLGVLAHAKDSDDPTIVISLIATPAAKIGQTVTVSVTASPKAGQGTDVNPANDTASSRVQFTGSAALSYTIRPAHKKVELGATTTVQLTVHNAGPQPAGGTIAFSIVVGDSFKISGFSGNTTPPANAAAFTGNSMTPPTPQGVLWFVGNIAAGHSATATLTLKATKLGSSQIGLIALSQAADPNCPDLDCEPTTVTMQVVPVPPVVTPASTPTTRPLANTGTAAERELSISAALLLVGALMTVAGTRRRRA